MASECENILVLASICRVLMNSMRSSNYEFSFSGVNAGLTALVSLNVSNSHITNDGLPYLKPLKNLQLLSLESCKEISSEIKKLQSTALPNLVSF